MRLKQSATNIQPALEYGIVKDSLKDKLYELEVSFGSITAMLAAGCLLKPEVDDKVLVSMDMSGTSYILSVLERQDKMAFSKISVPGSCRLESESGQLELRAHDSLHLSSAGDVDVGGSSITISADKANVCISNISILGSVLHQQIKRITTIAKSVEHSFMRLTQRMNSSERFVKEHEEVQTGSTRYLVEDTLTTQAGNTLNISEELHTMHAEQIHMG